MLIFVQKSSGRSFSCRRAETGMRSVCACSGCKMYLLPSVAPARRSLSEVAGGGSRRGFQCTAGRGGLTAPWRGPSRDSRPRAPSAAIGGRQRNHDVPCKPRRQSHSEARRYRWRVARDCLRIPTIATSHSEGSRPPVPIDRDQGGAGLAGAVGCGFDVRLLWVGQARR
jgi:hypothetical protein